MRVTVVSAWDPRRVGDGACLVLHHHLVHLAAGHEVTVLTSDPAGVPGEVDAPYRVQRLGAARPRGDGMRRRIASLRTGEPAHALWVEAPALLAALAAQRPDPPDVLHLFGWGTAQLHQWLPGTPAVHVAVDPWSVNHGNRGGGPLRWLLEREQAAPIAAHERRHYPRVAAVVVVAPHDAAQLRATVPGARVEVVPNGVDPGPDPVDRAEGAPVLAFHGAFEAHANVDAALVLVRAVLPRVREAVPGARVLLIGRGPPPAVQRLASAAVTVTGAVPAVRPWLERAAVYVAPMTSGTGLKNKVLEAMTAGLPVVATPRAVSGIGEGPGVVARPDPAGIADAVVTWLDDPAARARAGSAGRARALADFSWARSAAAIAELWQEAAGTRLTRGTP